MLSRPCSEAQQKGQRTAAFHAGGTRVTEMRPRLCSRAGEAWDPGVTLARLLLTATCGGREVADTWVFPASARGRC